MLHPTSEGTLFGKNRKTGVAKDGADNLASSIKPEGGKKDVITDLLLRDVRYCHNGSSFCSAWVEEVSISYYEDRTDSSLFSLYLSVSPAVVCAPHCLSTCW